MRPVVIIIRDGWGVSDQVEGNAVKAADTPHIDAYYQQYPWTLLDCAGEAVGLPAGFMGSSEAGHLNMGAGRIVEQELKRVNDMMADGDFWETAMYGRVIERCLSNPDATLHLMGLLQDEGVHAHEDHLYKIVAHAHDAGVRNIRVHVFTDGRDTPPRSVMDYLPKLEAFLAEHGPNARIGTLMGRYYAMDRSRNWALTDRAFRCIVRGEGRRAASATEAVEEAYAQDTLSNGEPVFDEYIVPYAIGDYAGAADGDAAIHFNYRQDRAIQLSMAFVADDYPGERDGRPDVLFAGLTRYYDEFPNAILESLDTGAGMRNLLGEVVSDAGLKQLRIAETQKFRHVTSFFNGKRTTPYPLEDQVEIPSEFDASSFAEHPEMNAYDVRDELLRRMQPDAYALYVVNFANCDMVGHTGHFAAAVKAVEIVDECVGAVVDRALELDAHVLLTADHGNAEQMTEARTGKVRTAHSDCFPVECFYIARDAPGATLIPRGKLSDIAPTTLRLLGLAVPPEMTADNLIAGR